MGQIIFPDTLNWNLGSFNNVKNVGQYLRLQYLHEDNTPAPDWPVGLWNGQPYWDLTQNTDWHYITGGCSADRTVVVHLLYDATNSVGGGLYLRGINNGPYKYLLRDNSTFAGHTVTDTDYIGITINLYSSGSHCGVQVKGFFLNAITSMSPGTAYRYFYVYLRLARVFALTSGLVQSLYFDVLGNRFKSQGEWLSPIIDLGPYINITSLEVQNYVVPTGGDVKIFYRASGSAPSTGSPIAFTDTSGNTLYYYGPNETWTASDWVEVPSGSVPTYKDRFVQLKLQLIAA